MLCQKLHLHRRQAKIERRICYKCKALLWEEEGQLYTNGKVKGQIHSAVTVTKNKERPYRICVQSNLR